MNRHQIRKALDNATSIDEAKSLAIEFFDKLEDDETELLHIAYIQAADAVTAKYENQKCSNCEYLSTTSYISSGLDIHEHHCSNNSSYVSEVDIDFSCNEWIKQDD